MTHNAWCQEVKKSKPSNAFTSSGHASRKNMINNGLVPYEWLRHQWVDNSNLKRHSPQKLRALRKRAVGRPLQRHNGTTLSPGKATLVAVDSHASFHPHKCLRSAASPVGKSRFLGGYHWQPGFLFLDDRDLYKTSCAGCSSIKITCNRSKWQWRLDQCQKTCWPGWAEPTCKEHPGHDEAGDGSKVN